MWAEERIIERNKKVVPMNGDTDGHCDVIWAKVGNGVWGLCHVFENTLKLNHDLMEDSAVPSNLSVPKLPEPDRRNAQRRRKPNQRPIQIAGASFMKDWFCLLFLPPLHPAPSRSLT